MPWAPVFGRCFHALGAHAGGRRVRSLARWRKAALALTLALGSGLAAQAQAQVSFAPARPFATGLAPAAVAIADINRDGKPDLIVANLASDTVSVLLGNGDGTFGLRADFPTGDGPRSIAVADVNGDGKPDLIVANAEVANMNAGTVSVLLGNGDGTFRPKNDVVTFSKSWVVAVADLNRDGKPDLVAGSDDPFWGGPEVLAGNGDGTFPGANELPSTNNAPRSRSLAIGDLNGDGKPDLVVASLAGNFVGVNLGIAGGGFAQAFSFLANAADPESVAIADLNGDGQLDFVFVNFGANTVSVVLRTGAFGPTGFTKTDYPTGPAPIAVTIGDANGDGKPDLVVVNMNARTVSVLLGTGTGAFGPKTDFATGAAGANPFAVAVGDVNGDGKPDLAVANFSEHTVSVLLNTTTFPGAGSFGAPLNFPAGSWIRSVALADLNRDGKLDLVVGNPNETTISVRLGDGAGSFGAKTDFGTGARPAFAAIGDLNRDGKPDLAVANESGNSVSVLLGNGDGTFGAKTDVATGDSPRPIAIGDLNRDGKLDIVVGNLNASTVSILLGNGDGTFGAKVDFGTGQTPISLALADVNRDGKPDLVVGNYDSYGQPSSVSVLLGDGAGGFGPKTDFPAGSGLMSVAVGDVNGDGKPDLVVSNSPASFGNPSFVSVLLGDGAGGFGPKTDFSIAGGAQSVAVADVNRDGKPDLLVATEASEVSVLLGYGDATFAGTTNFSTGSGPVSVAVGDLNGDGRPDLVTANEVCCPSTVSVLLNRAPTVALTKTLAPDPATVGSPLTYAILVTNSGLTAATGVTISDPLPAGVTFVSATTTPQGTCTTPSAGGTGTVSCDLGTLAGGATAVVTIVVTPTAVGPIRNAASLTGTVAGPAMAAAATSVGLPSFGLAVVRAGSGGGAVTSTPAGITCGSDCSESYPSGTSVTLVAAVASSSFAGWSGGGCSGIGACTVIVTATTTVTATFWEIVTPGFTPGGTVIKAIHFTELRDAIDSLRLARGLGAFPWAEALVPGTTLVRRAHLEELRTALDQAYQAAGRTLPTYAESILAGQTVVKASHLNELRTAIWALR